MGGFPINHFKRGVAFLILPSDNRFFMAWFHISVLAHFVLLNKIAQLLVFS